MQSPRVDNPEKGTCDRPVRHLPEGVVGPLAHEDRLEFGHVGHLLRELSAVGLFPRFGKNLLSLVGLLAL